MFGSGLGNVRSAIVVAWVVGWGLVSPPTVLRAQQPTNTSVEMTPAAVIKPPRASILRASTPIVVPTSWGLAGTDTLRKDSQTAWKEGALIGGLGLGLAAAVLGASLCESGEECSGTIVVFGLIGATVGAVAGAFVGSTIEKRPKT